MSSNKPKTKKNTNANKRKLSYSLAINEAIHQLMEKDPSVLLIGQGVKSPWYVGNTCKGLFEKFGKQRVLDTPISENAIHGIAMGAGLAGMRAIVSTPRMDFMMYALDPIINEAANWHYMSGGKSSVPMVIWGIINRGGEQAAQHSQALESIFCHIPGLKVVAPSTPFDAKGLLVSAVSDNNPVLYIDDRWLYNIEAEVPKEIYSVPIGKGIVRKTGKDLTIVSFSYLAQESQKAANILAREKISAEVIDLRSLKPLDIDLIVSSVKKTGRLLIAEGAWLFGSFSAEISAQIQERIFKSLKSPVVRICLPDVPAPMSRSLEQEYYIDAQKIAKAAKKLLK